MNAPTAVLVSGSGRHLRNLLELERAGILETSIDLVIASKPGIPALDHAAEYDVEAKVLKPDEINAALEAAGIEWIVLAGYLKHWPLPERYRGRAINIHPSILPLFGGKGFYGDRVHKAVLEAGMRVSGCTVHFVSDEYDQGPIIDQRAVTVAANDTPSNLAARVFEAELELLPAVVAGLLQGHIEQEGARVIDRRPDSRLLDG